MQPLAAMPSSFFSSGSKGGTVIPQNVNGVPISVAPSPSSAGEATGGGPVRLSGARASIPGSPGRCGKPHELLEN